MPLTPDPGARDRALALKGLTRDDIDPDEMDNVIMRIFKELRHQLSLMESQEPERLTTADRERHARILSNLERTMERLTKLHAERTEARKSKADNNDGSARKAVHSKIARIVAVEFEKARAQRDAAAADQ